jgi:hypothetical protein
MAIIVFLYLACFFVFYSLGKQILEQHGLEKKTKKEQKNLKFCNFLLSLFFPITVFIFCLMFLYSIKVFLVRKFF